MENDIMQTEGSAETGGYCIEIYVGADGAISVATESKAEEQGEGGENEGRTPVSSIKEALTMALDIYKSNGNAGNEQQDFDSGYGGKSVVKV